MSPAVKYFRRAADYEDMSTESAKTLIFPWRIAYSVGIPEIDNQHKALVRLINDLQSAMMDGNGRNVVAGIVDDLVLYTEIHFAYEEDMLRRQGYPGLESHCGEHKKLTLQVCEFREKVRYGKLTITMTVLTFLKNWLADHILKCDQAYATPLGGGERTLK